MLLLLLWVLLVVNLEDGVTFVDRGARDATLWDRRKGRQKKIRMEAEDGRLMYWNLSVRLVVPCFRYFT